MDANWRPTQGSAPAAVAAGVDPNAPAPAGGDWRAQLQPEARGRIVDKITRELVRHLPVSVPEDLNQLRSIAVRFEDKIHTVATSQADYLRKISLKMLSMETNRRQAPGNAQVIPNQNNPGSESQGSDPNAPAPAPAPAGGDWQDQFCPEERCRIVDKITTELRRHHPGSEPEALNENKLLAAQFEHEMYTVATSQADYLRKIRQKMLSIETNRRQAPGNAQVIPNQNNPGSEAELQQSVQSLLLQPQQSVVRQQQQPQPLMHQQPSLQQAQPSQQPNIPLQQQQQQLMGQQPNLQQNQLIGQQQQQHAQQPSVGLMQSQSQHNQLQQSQQHPMSQFQSQPNQLQQQFGMQQQRLPTSAGMLLQQNHIDQQKQFIQQRDPQEVSSSTSVDSTAQTGHAGAGDWQEEIYQMIQSLRDQYFVELDELYNKVSRKLVHVACSNTLPYKPCEQYERMMSFKIMLERILQILQVNQSNTQPALRDKIPMYEKQIISILNSQKRRPTQAQQLFPAICRASS